MQKTRFENALACYVDTVDELGLIAFIEQHEAEFRALQMIAAGRIVNVGEGES